MQSDIQALSARISRLEQLLGPQKQKPCVHATTKSALSNLRKQVPDEMAAAHQAVNLLSRITHTTTTPIDIQRIITALEELQALQSSLRPPLHELDAAQVTNLQLRVAGVEKLVREEERGVDALITEFDAVVTRLNMIIVAIARRLSVHDGVN